ncbi:MAG: hypothetical protein K8H74_17995 [Notoacmeibacter sp.]|nr:hypothetical protein [Notoacmeibacter sp.]
MAARTNKRSRSGAHHECPECGKKLRGEKGLMAHRKAEHGVETNPADPAAILPSEREGAPS